MISQEISDGLRLFYRCKLILLIFRHRDSIFREAEALLYQWVGAQATIDN